mmetsp:Transcript_41735/g.99005  ORF Transcript_41735/g.99005 Transcript_41735/m.99005 type:complete len:216 (-) Transcript_41735:100-747(-)
MVNGICWNFAGNLQLDPSPMRRISTVSRSQGPICDRSLGSQSLTRIERMSPMSSAVKRCVSCVPGIRPSSPQESTSGPHCLAVPTSHRSTWPCTALLALSEVQKVTWYSAECLLWSWLAAFPILEAGCLSMTPLRPGSNQQPNSNVSVVSLPRFVTSILSMCHPGALPLPSRQPRRSLVIRPTSFAGIEKVATSPLGSPSGFVLSQWRPVLPFEP